MPLFATVPAYNATTGQDRDELVNLNAIDHIAPHDNVTVKGISTVCVEAFFHSGSSILILLDIYTLADRLGALSGAIDNYGNLT